MTVGNNTVKTDLVKVGCLELKHLVDTVAVDPVTSITDLLGSTVLATESSLDDLLSVLLEEFESLEVSTCRDLDQLCEPVSDLCFGESLVRCQLDPINMFIRIIP